MGSSREYYRRESMMDVLAGGKRVGQRLASRRVAERKKGSTTKVDIWRETLKG